MQSNHIEYILEGWQCTQIKYTLENPNWEQLRKLINYIGPPQAGIELKAME
jgi:hypothetical protein